MKTRTSVLTAPKPGKPKASRPTRSIKTLMDLSERVAVITGGAGHLGAVMGEALAEAGARVVLVDCAAQECRKKAQTIGRQYKVQTLPLAVDLADERQTKGIPGKVLESFGRLDILINCAAFVGTSELKGWAVPFEQQTVETWRKTMDVNLTAVFALTQACQPALADSGQGSVINITSLYGMVGPDMRLYEGTNLGNPAAYAAAKGGVIQLTRWLATVLAPKVRVNAISLGGVFRGHKDPFLSRYVERTPLKRMATEEDLKGAALYLASGLSNYVTGHNLVVDGGWTAW